MTQNRPTIRDLEDTDLLKIANDLFEAYSGNFKSSDIDEDDIFQSIKDIGNENGYEYAKHLEDRYSAYHVDSIIVEALDSIQWDLYRAREEKIKEWVKKYNINPLFSVGDMVSHRHGKNTIHEIDYERAQYKINTDKDNSKYIVNFEDVTKANDV